MKRRIFVVSFLIVFALGAQLSFGFLQVAKVSFNVSAADEPIQQVSDSGHTVVAIVELESEPVAAYQRRSERIPRREIDFASPGARAHELRLESEHASFKSRAALVSPNLRVRTELRRLANAVSIEAAPAELVAIAAMPGVKRVELATEYVAMIDASVPLVNAPAFWNALGGAANAGEGMKIAILDTGIDTSNPLFSGDGYTAPEGFPRSNNGSESFTNNKVIVAKSFLSGNNASARDENGHGTNCAGIAAGNAGTVSPVGVLSGVAPRAYLGNYRVLGASGSGSTDLIGKAVEEAVADQFDVISMSLGSQTPPSASGFLEGVIESAVAAGATVVVAAGNNNADLAGQQMTIRSPGIAPSAITVGASTNAHVVGPVVTVNGPEPVTSNLINIASTSGTEVALDNSIVAMPLVDIDPQGRGCNSLQANSLSGKVALIERGGCNFSTKINNAAAAGARAVIVLNNDPSEGSTNPGEELPTMVTDGTVIPAVLVRRSSGLALRSFLSANLSVTLSIAPIGSAAAVSDVIASFSALGPSVLEGLKPDVTAPGTNIYSGALFSGDPDGIVDGSGFASVSGTSQATPHVAGAAALLKQQHPTWTPGQIKSALVTSSITEVFTSADRSAAAGVLSAGGGRMDLALASSISATISPASLSFGINKLKKKDVIGSIDLAVTSQLDGQNTFTIEVHQLNPGDGVSVTPSQGSISLAGGETGTVSIVMAAIRGSQRRDYTGYLVVIGGDQTLRVPYWVRYVKKKN